MKKNQRVCLGVLALGLFLAAADARAHSIWIEEDEAGRLGVCFGEYENDLREKSGGKLDSMEGLEAWRILPGGEKAEAAPVKGDDRFAIEGEAAEGAAAQFTRGAVREGGKYGPAKTKSYFYARFADIEEKAEPFMILDAVPAGTGDAAVAVTFEGKPLAKAKAVLVSPAGWTKTFRADEAGIVKIESPWKGLHILEVSHEVERPGTYEGKEYEREKHKISFSFELA